jgi:hypothetical protein
MKIFDQKDPWHYKVNFVDENNVVLGYDMEQSCCEDANWTVLDEEPIDKISYFDDLFRKNQEPEDYEGFVFDKTYMKDLVLEGGDEGSAVCFKMVKESEEKFIVVYNAHNGYYSHGFEFKDNDETLREDYI